MLLSLSMLPTRDGNQTGSRTAPERYLSDDQWAIIADLFPMPVMTSVGGRPRVPPRHCLEGVLWILVSGARWRDLPERYPSPATCWRRLKEWTENNVFKTIWIRLLGKLDEFKNVNWEEAIADGTFAAAKKGVPTLATRRREKELRSC